MFIPIMLNDLKEWNIINKNLYHVFDVWLQQNSVYLWKIKKIEYIPISNHLLNDKQLKELNNLNKLYPDHYLSVHNNQLCYISIITDKKIDFDLIYWLWWFNFNVNNNIFLNFINFLTKINIFK